MKPFHELTDLEIRQIRDALLIGPPTKPKRGRGQPPKPNLLTNDVKRAFLLYVTVERIRNVKGIGRDQKIEIPLYRLIKIAEQTFPTHGLFERPTYANKMLASVKRGRAVLGIDDDWRGPPPESLFDRD